MAYFPFGETWIDRGPNTQRIPYRYTAQTLDQDTKLYYYGARYYDPRTSVWESADSILGQYLNGQPNGGVYNPGNLGLYSYSYQSPVGYRDPNGRFPDPVDAIFLIRDTGKLLGASAAWIQGAATGNQQLRNMAFAGVLSNGANVGMDLVLPGGSEAAHVVEDVGEHALEHEGEHALASERRSAVRMKWSLRSGPHRRVLIGVLHSARILVGRQVSE